MMKFYKRIYMPNHHRANKGGYVLEHVVIAENKINRLLLDEEVVHHIDGDIFNNIESNLMVFKTQSDHAAYHMGVEAILDVDVYYCPSKMQKMCDCGNIKDGNSKICNLCYNKLRSKNVPVLEQLKSDLEYMNFIQIGKKYNVSDNAVRKWCKKYGIKYKRYKTK